MVLPKNAIQYLKGLLCVFESANCVAMSLVTRCSHDSLTRVLKGQSRYWQTLLTGCILRTVGTLQGGWLMLDDTTISKCFARKIETIGWIYDSKVGRSILGINVVLIAWSNGTLTIPLALRVYQKESGKSKFDLAVELIEYAKSLRVEPEYVAFDSWYAADKVFQIVQKCEWVFVTRLKSNRKLNGVPIRKMHRHPYWMETGKIAGGTKVLVVRHGKRYFATDDFSLSKQNLLKHYQSRWEIETIFRMLHGQLGFDECQALKREAQLAHFHLCLMAYIALEREGCIRRQTLYRVKRDCSLNFQYADSLLSKLNFQGA